NDGGGGSGLRPLVGPGPVQSDSRTRGYLSGLARAVPCRPARLRHGHRRGSRRLLRGDDLSVASGGAPRSGAGAPIRMTVCHEATKSTKPRRIVCTTPQLRAFVPFVTS